MTSRMEPPNPLKPPVAPAEHSAEQPPIPAEAAAGAAESRRRWRVGVVICVVVALLVGVGAGGAGAAQRFAQARRIPVATPVTYVTPLAPIVRPGAGKPPLPVALANCACDATHANIPAPSYGTPQVAGQVVLVSIAQQWLWAYQDGRMVMATPVTTGMPQLPTPTGIYNVMMKESNVMFYSPWPYGSPYYYTPEHVDYAMLFRAGGFYLHSAGWRHEFGPGTNVPHTDPDGTWETGSHGCVNLPVSAAGALYGWINDGATVIIV